MDHGGLLRLRELVDNQSARHNAALVDELAGHLDSELEQARTGAAAAAAEQERLRSAVEIELAREGAIRDTRLAVAESFNQTLRRIRQVPTEAEALGIVLESTAPYAAKAVVLEVENNQARSAGVRGSETCEFAFSLDTAAAVASVCETREPLVVLASEKELSPELASALTFDSAGGDSAQKAYLFPVVARHEVIAVLVVSAEPATAPLIPSALELLSEAAGMKIEALKSEMSAAREKVLKPLSSPELVQIVPPSVPETAGTDRLSWASLSPDDQKLHLQAQRVARVKVAEMRLYHPDELRKGVFESNIYGALNSEIDRARADFLQTFLSKSPTMVDYLHIEILRSLAHEDDGLLGEEYPGPMV